MRKQLAGLMAIVFIMGLFANMAVAADNLKISGNYWIQGWMKDNYTNGDDDDDTDKLNYTYQRLRTQLEFKGSENIKAVTRLDFAEGVWGGDDMQAYRPTAGTNNQLQVDRAYLDVTKGIYNIKGGLQWLAAGYNIAFRDNQPGLLLTVNTPVKLRVAYIKRDENGLSSDEEIAGVDYDDVNRYLLEAQYNGDNFEVKGFTVFQTDGGADQDEPFVVGVAGKYVTDLFTLTAELDTFGGNKGNVDYVGTQLFADVNFKLSDRLYLAFDMVYSTGEDDADKEKITYVGNPFGYTNITESGWGVNITEGFLLPLGGSDIWDPKGGNAGSIGLGTLVKFTPVDKLDLYGQIVYLTAEEDVDTAYDTATVLNLAAVYTILPKCKLSLLLNHTSIDAQTGSDPDDATCLFSELRVSF